ncbi:MAG: hypothetical protein JRJ40_10090 [Deltaproteobacteria bacterium]|nr:hypothetical protein [Deltaproteobacteria bacterium]MBW1931858.1 hypothetical protein [Deltaproteobacteria bacterium]
MRCRKAERRCQNLMLESFRDKPGGDPLAGQAATGIKAAFGIKSIANYHTSPWLSSWSTKNMISCWSPEFVLTPPSRGPLNHCWF